MLRNYGAAQNFADSGGIQDKLYADAMAMASAYYTLQRSGNQARPLKVQELLPTMEYENGMEPLATDTLFQRRRAISVRRKMILGGKIGDISQSLTDLLGDKLIGYRTVRADELEQSAATILPPGAIDFFPKPGSNYVEVSTPTRIIRNLFDISTTGRATLEAVEYVSGSNFRPYQSGQKVLVGAGTDHAEVVSILSDDGAKVSAAFTKAHPAGTLWTSQNYPLNWSDKRRHLIFVTMPTVLDNGLRKNIDDLMKIQVKGTAVWSILGVDNPPSQSGFFRIGVSGIGTVAFGTALSGIPV
jgi:hypothetical protein